jgi:YHYH protein
MKRRRLTQLLLLGSAAALIVATSMQLNSPASAETTATAAKCGSARLAAVKYFPKTVSIMCDSTWMYVSSLEIPNDEMMVGITGWNQQVPLPFVMSDVLSTMWKIPLKATYSKSTTATTGVGATALMVNGVPLFNATKPSQNGNQSSYQSSADPLLTGELDNCDGHSGRGDDYHYHAYPTCLVTALVAMSHSSKAKNSQLGWGLDGYPIYGLTEANGAAVSKLDACLGHDLKNGLGYHYHFTSKPPYSPMCFHGVLPIENNPEHQPAAAPGRQVGAPVKVLITAMEFNLTGKSTLSFTYNGTAGSVSYTPVTSSDSKKDCWQFEYLNPTPGSPGSGSQLVCRPKFGKGS